MDLKDPVRIERLNRVIAAISAEPKHFIMSDWINSSKERFIDLKCGTAGCIGGWMESLAMQDAAADKFAIPTYEHSPAMPFHHADLSIAWLGLKRDVDPEQVWELDSLFMMDRAFSMSDFDKLPAEDRARAAVRAIEIFRDTGESNWAQALRDTGLYESLERMDEDEDEDEDDDY